MPVKVVVFYNGVLRELPSISKAADYVGNLMFEILNWRCSKAYISKWISDIDRGRMMSFYTLNSLGIDVERLS